MQVVLATVKRQVFDEECAAVVLPTAAGQIEVLPDHAHLLAELQAGVMRVKKNANEPGKPVVLDAGFVQVSDGKVRVVTEQAALPEEVDEQQTRTELEALTERVKQEGLSAAEITQNNRKIRFARAKLNALGAAR